MKKVLFFLFTGLFSSLFGQTVLYKIDTGGVRQVCSAVFTDDGGPAGNYNGDRHEIITFKSVYPSLLHLRLDFSRFDVRPSDTLYVYDGTDTLSPLIGKYNNSNTVAPFNIQSAVSNQGSAVTFRFKSGINSGGAGWYAVLKCIPVCQKIVAALSPQECYPPLIYEADSTVRGVVTYINVCIGEDFTLAASASGSVTFPENDIVYHQDETNTLFIWKFGDFTGDTGRIVTHRFNSPGGYTVKLRVEDARGCENTNTFLIRARVPGSPLRRINPLPPVCSEKDSALISIGDNGFSTIVIRPYSFNNLTNHHGIINDSTHFIPDGPNCPPGCLRTSLILNNIDPFLKISSPDDIQSICVNMEHSFLGDLGFRITCPNGQSVTLDPNNHGGGGTNLGIPLEGINDGSPQCDPAANQPGTGWTYCWSEKYQTDTAYTIEFAGDHASGTLDSTNRTNNTNYFYPAHPFSGLIGCPLYGAWTLEICDDWGIDNGYLFRWELNLNPDLYNQSDSLYSWGFSVGIDSVTFINNHFIRIDSTHYIFRTHNSDNESFNVSIRDDFGCYFSGNGIVSCVQTPVFHLPEDTLACVSLNLYGPLGYWTPTYLWSNYSTSDYITVSTPSIYWLRASYSAAGKECSWTDSTRVRFMPPPEINGFATSGSDTIYMSSMVIRNIDINRSYGNYIYDGRFSIIGLDPGNYIMYVQPDQSLYPGILPGYYNNTPFWQNADTINNQCGIINNIHIELPVLYSAGRGSGRISGNVYYLLDSNVVPAENITVYNENVNTDRLVGLIETDSFGYYSFSSLSFGKYTIGIDYNFFQVVDPYIIDYNSHQYIFDHRDFYIYNNKIYPDNPMGVGDNIQTNIGQPIIYPNPAYNTLNVIIPIRMTGNVYYQLFGIAGNLLKEGAIIGAKSGIDVSMLTEGVYLLQLKFESNIFTTRFIKN